MNTNQKDQKSEPLIYIKKKKSRASHRELCSVLSGSPDGRGVWGRLDTCAHVAEFLCCPPETNSVNWLHSSTKYTFLKNSFKGSVSSYHCVLLIVLVVGTVEIMWHFKASFVLFRPTLLRN